MVMPYMRVHKCTVQGRQALADRWLYAYALQETHITQGPEAVHEGNKVMLHTVLAMHMP